MPTDIYVEGTEDSEHPIISKQGKRLWKQFVASFMHEVGSLFEAEGVATDPASEERLAELIIARLAQALDRHHRQRHGDFSPDPLPDTFPMWDRKPAVDTSLDRAASGTPRRPSGPSSVSVTVSLRGLYLGRKAVAVVKPRVVAETDYVVRSLAAFAGDDAARITRDELIRWRDSIKAGGANNNTWNNRLSMVRQVLLHGVNQGLLKEDPTTGIRLRKSRQKSPPPYTDADAAHLLLAARKETQPSLRWAHWVMAFSGLRAGEVLQLLGRDVRQDGSIWLIDVNEDHPTQSVKNSERRHVPIHPALIREGFVAYAQTAAPDAPLFPDKRLDQHGKRGGRAWNLIGKWVRRVGITDPDKAPDHSWRHRIEDELRAAEVPEDVRDAIVGHSRKTTGRQYGVRGEALTRLHRYLSRVPIPPGVFEGDDRAAA